MTEKSTSDHRSSWKARFFTIWGGQALSLLGSQLVQFGLIWHLTVQTGSATVLAAASLAGMLPGIVLGPFAGAIVDRCNRRRIMILADGAVALAALFLAVLFVFDIVEVWHIFVVLFVRATAGSFHTNAMTASTSLMVPDEHLTRIQGINQMLNGGLNIVSAPLGALLLSLLPMQGILAVDVSTAVIAVLPLLWIQVPQPEASRQADDEPRSIWSDFSEGLHFVMSWPGLMIIGLMTVGINFTIIPAFSLMPLLVSDFFGGSAAELGWVESAMGVGMLAGGALLGVWGGFRRRISTSMAGLIGMGAGTLVLALAPESALYLAVFGALVVGLMTPLTMGPFYAVIQSIVAPGMQARVFSLLSSVGTVMVPIGLLIAGPAADRFGIQSWFMMGGVLCALMGAAGFLLPAVMNIEERKKESGLVVQPIPEPIDR